MTPQLCLGTAQFGLAYGISNAVGQVSEGMVAQLLAEAEEAGVRWLDTAQAYGNAEAVLGRQFPASHRFRLVSKLPAQSQLVFSAEHANTWEQAFHASCQRLGVQCLDAFLLHTPQDLRKRGGQHLEAWLLSLRERGLVQRIGMSIYTAQDLEAVNPSLLNLVQLPLSLFDQRLLQDGTLARLRAGGTAIHARSLYLQGLLLTPAAQWPCWVNPEARVHHQALEIMAGDRGCHLIDLALGFIKEVKEIDVAVVGVCSSRELADTLKAWMKKSPWLEKESRLWSLGENSLLDPREWLHANT